MRPRDHEPDGHAAGGETAGDRDRGDAVGVEGRGVGAAAAGREPVVDLVVATAGFAGGIGFRFPGERVVDLGRILASGGDDDKVEAVEVRVDEAARGGEELVVACGVGGGGGLGSGGRVVDAGETGAVESACS